MNKYSIIIIAITLSYHFTYSQECGTPSPENPTIYPENNAPLRRSSGAQPFATSYCVNVYFHIVRYTSTAIAFTEPNIDTIVRNLNRYFSPHGIVIRNAGNQHINNNDLVDISASEKEREGRHKTFYNMYRRDNAINYFIVRSINGSSGSVNGFAHAAPSTALFIISDSVLACTSPHELGHCLGLYHTFRGSPAELRGCAETISGSNCRTCGDCVCDTKADQNRKNFGGYTPDLTNIMCIINFHRIHFFNLN